MLRSHQIALLEEKKDEGAGGGGAAKPFTDEQQTAIGQVVNAAVTSHLKRSLGPAIADGLKGVNWAETLKLDEVLGEKLKTLKSEEPADKAKEPAKPDPKMAALEATVQELKALRQADADALKKAQETARDKDAMAALKSTLGPHVRPEALEVAASHLFLAQKRVTYDENGNPLFSIKRAPYAGAAEEDTQMPLADGVQHWLKTDEAKLFIPAPGTAPTQGRGPAGPRSPAQRSAAGIPTYDQPATTDAEKIRRANEQAQVYAAKYPHLADL